MNAKSRRKLEMGQRALEFSRAHPDTSVGYTTAVDRLADRLTAGEQVARQQRDGLLEVRAATQTKKGLRRTMVKAHLKHLIRAARLASREVPAISAKFEGAAQVRPYATFRTVASAVVGEAESNKDLLLKYGLSEPVCDSLKAALEQLDAAIERGNRGRRAHVGASADLDGIASEVVGLVGLIDGMNQVRFVGQVELLAEWKNASDVRATPVKSPPAEAAVDEAERPAA